VSPSSFLPSLVVHSPEHRVFLRRQVKQAELIRRRFAYGPSWLVTKRMGLAWGVAALEMVSGMFAPRGAKGR
jgi:hypothetical protein